jgi:hypothetical protein
MQSLISLKTLVVLGGLGQLAIAAGSLAIPRVLGWKQDTARLRPLTRQVFWTYAGYIWTTNVCFGLISTFASRLLLDRSPLAAMVCLYITAYWSARVIIQFTYFDRSDAPQSPLIKLGEAGLVSLFVYLALVYGAAASLSLFGGAS